MENETFTSSTKLRRERASRNKVSDLNGARTNLTLKESLGMAEPNYFYYLNQSSTYTADGQEDVRDFAAVKVYLIVAYSALACRMP